MALEDEKGSTVIKEESELPEGGWSWLIVLAVAMNKMAFWAALPCFGIVFADVLSTKPGEEGTSVASIMGTISITMCITSICSPALFRKFSHRQVGTTGGLLYLVGSLAAAFADSVILLILAYGGLQGLGFGLMLTSSLASFNQHFRRRRTVAMAVAQCVNGAAGAVLPLGVLALQAAAGSRAAKLIFSALTAAAAASQLLLKPPPVPALGRHPAQHCLAEQETNVTGYSCNDKEALQSPVAESSKSGRSTARPWVRRLWRATGLKGRLLRDPMVVVVATGVSLVHLMETNFFAMLPLHLRELMDGTRVAQTVTAATAGEFSGRVVLVLCGRWLSTSNRIVFASSALATAAAIIALSLATSWSWLVALAAVLGVCKGALYITSFLSLAEIVTPSEFPCAVAMQFFMLFVCSFVVSPVIGQVRDATGSFPVCFRVVAGLMALCPCAWGLQMALQKYARRRRRAASVDIIEMQRTANLTEDGGVTVSVVKKPVCGDDEGKSEMR